MKTIVIYHRADFDGLFSREVARRHFGYTAEYLGWDYGDPLPVIPADSKQVYMIDISVDGLMDDPRLIWIDHHKSAIDKYRGDIKGYRIDGVAACRLAWQYFFSSDPVGLPGKEMFVNREVVEPLALRLAGEYDIWDKRDPRADLFQHGLRTRELTAEVWEALLGPGSDIITGALLEAGGVLQFAREKENASVIKAQGFTVRFEGLLFLACNAARYNSHLFTAGLLPEHDGCLGFNWDGKKRKWRCSLYGVPGKPDVDLSLIAVKYGGGGHKQACGFECVKLPFQLEAAA
jgi:hypothetical protein